jgi:hypothetical protein
MQHGVARPSHVAGIARCPRRRGADIPLPAVTLAHAPELPHPHQIVGRPQREKRWENDIDPQTCCRGRSCFGRRGTWTGARRTRSADHGRRGSESRSMRLVNIAGETRKGAPHVCRCRCGERSRNVCAAGPGYDRHDGRWTTAGGTEGRVSVSTRRCRSEHGSGRARTQGRAEGRAKYMDVDGGVSRVLVDAPRRGG